MYVDEEDKQVRTMRNFAEINTLESWLQRKNHGLVALEDLSKSQRGSAVTSYGTFHPSYYSYLPQSLQNISILKPADINVAEWG